jgi:transposase
VGGEIIEDEKKGRRFERENVVGALCDGGYFALECYRQATDGEFFERWFENRLLEEIPQGYTIIMDNARFHRKTKLRKLARGKVRLLFLPPYSPDYNPIEKTWANMKRSLCNNLQDFKSVASAIYDYFNVSAI